MPSKAESSPNLEDIFEADNPFSSRVSPLHQQSCSNATSTESSPYTSQPSSPPAHHDEPEHFQSMEERARVGRSMSLDLMWRPSPEPYAEESESLMRLGIQRSTSLMSKFRSMAQQARPAEIVKDFLSSISPVPVANAVPLDLGSAPVMSSGLSRRVIEEDVIKPQPLSPEECDGPLPSSPTEAAPSPPSNTQLQISAETEQFITSVESAM